MSFMNSSRVSVPITLICEPISNRIELLPLSLVFVRLTSAVSGSGLGSPLEVANTSCEMGDDAVGVESGAVYSELSAGGGVSLD